MATIQKEILIGGLPATKFVGRQIKVQWDDKYPHPSACKCVAVEKDAVVVIVTGGRGALSRRVDPGMCKPWWAQNPDLKLEAEALGLQFSGTVSVGRAFEAATSRPAAPPRVISVESAPVTATPLQAPPPVMEPEPTTVTTALVQTPSPAAPSPSPHHLVKLEIPTGGDGNWVDDMREFYRVRAVLQGGDAVLDDLRAQIEKLQQELVIKAQEVDRSKEENTVMLELLIEQLTALGVVFHWAGEVVAPPVQAPHKVKQVDFSEVMIAWVNKQATPFTFQGLFLALREEDSSAKRLVVKRYCRKRGIQIDARRGPGTKTTFYPTGKMCAV